MLATRVDLLQEPQPRLPWVLPVGRVDQQLREAEDRVQRRPQLVAHAGEEHALVFVRLLQLGIRFLQLVEQPRPVEGGGDRRHELLHAADFIGAEARGERPREHREPPADAHTAYLQEEKGRALAIQLDVVHAWAQRADRELELRYLIGIEASRREQCPVGFKRRGRCAARQPHGPVERAVGEDRAALLEEKRVLHERSQALLFGSAPLTAKPGRGRKAEVQQRHDRQHDDLDRQLNHRVGRGGRGGGDREQEDGDDAREAKAQGPQPPCLNRRKRPRHQPEANDWLGDQGGPHEHEDDGGRQRVPGSREVAGGQE